MSNAPLCRCGCGNNVTRQFKGKWDRYCYGHKKFIGEFIPPLCQCGCGNSVKYNYKNKKWNDYYDDHFNKSTITPFCACGCGAKVTWSIRGHKWITYLTGHQKRIPLLDDTPLCACGCGQYVTRAIKYARWNKYIKGHTGKQMAKDPKYKELYNSFSNRFKEKWQNPEYRKRKSLEAKKRWENPLFRENVLFGGKEYRNNPVNKQIIINRSREIMQKLWQNRDFRIAHSERLKKEWEHPERKEQRRIQLSNQRKDPNFINKLYSSQKKKPNKLETFIDLITSSNMQFIGDFQWWRTLKLIDINGNIIIKHKNPDFKIKGQNKVIEIHGDYWHRNDYPDQVWIDAWKRIGYDLIVIWEHEIKDDIESVLDKIADFVGEQNWQMSLNI